MTDEIILITSGRANIHIAESMSTRGPKIGAVHAGQFVGLNAVLANARENLLGYDVRPHSVSSCPCSITATVPPVRGSCISVDKAYQNINSDGCYFKRFRINRHAIDFEGHSEGSQFRSYAKEIQTMIKNHYDGIRTAKKKKDRENWRKRMQKEQQKKALKSAPEGKVADEVSLYNKGVQEWLDSLPLGTMTSNVSQIYYEYGHHKSHESMVGNAESFVKKTIHLHQSRMDTFTGPFRGQYAKKLKKDNKKRAMGDIAMMQRLIRQDKESSKLSKYIRNHPEEQADLDKEKRRRARRWRNSTQARLTAINRENRIHQKFFESATNAVQTTGFPPKLKLVSRLRTKAKWKRKKPVSYKI